MDRKGVITAILSLFVMLHGHQFTVVHETDQKIVPDLKRSLNTSPIDQVQNMKNKQMDIVHAHGHQRETMLGISRLFSSQNTNQFLRTSVFKSPSQSDKTHFPTFPSYSRIPGIPKWWLVTKLASTPLYTTKLAPTSLYSTKLVPSPSASQTNNPSSYRPSLSIIPSVRSKSPVLPTMPTMKPTIATMPSIMPSMQTASLTPSPTPPTMVTQPTPGAVTSKVVTGSSFPEKRILKKGFKTIEVLLLAIIVLIAAIACSLSAWFLVRLRWSQHKRSTKGYEVLAVGHI